MVEASVFLVLLRFSRRDQAGRWMDGHTAWLQRGFDDGVFLLAGSLQPRRGGAIVAHGVSESQLRARVERDPFVAEGVVDAEILEIIPSRTDDRLAFLVHSHLP